MKVTSQTPSNTKTSKIQYLKSIRSDIITQSRCMTCSEILCNGPMSFGKTKEWNCGVLLCNPNTRAIILSDGSKKTQMKNVFPPKAQKKLQQLYYQRDLQVKFIFQTKEANILIKNIMKSCTAMRKDDHGLVWLPHTILHNAQSPCGISQNHFANFFKRN